jgi:integrase
VTCIYREKHRDGWRLQTSVLGVRRKLWLGPITKRQAEQICEHVRHLCLCAETGTRPDQSVILWANSLGDRLHSRLSYWGLIESRSTSRGIRLSDWCDTVLALDKYKAWAKSTRYQMEKVKTLLVDQIGNKAVDAVTVADAEKFQAFLYSRGAIADSHAGKQIKRAKQFFAEAIKARLIERSPFENVKASSQIDKSRKAYITHDAAASILDKCPDQLWRVIFCLARYAGLRVPSEILTLEWTAIDWAKCRMRVVSPKQVRHDHRHVRIVPLSPLLVSELWKLHEQAKDKAVFVCDRYRTASTAQFRKPLLQAVEKAELIAWPKLWMNLRASCRTDWLKIAKPYAVNEWMGHDGKVGESHYDRLTEDDWSSVTAPTEAPTQQQQPSTDTKKPSM